MFIHKIVHCVFIDVLMEDYKTVTYPLKYILFPEGKGTNGKVRPRTGKEDPEGE